MTQRLSLGLMLREDWVKFVSIMSTHIAKKLNEIAETILGTTSEDLANIPFRLVDLEVRKKLKAEVKKVDVLDSTERGKGGFGHSGTR